jgi:DNA repair exonuclease SbcCD nuclease subunit
MIYITGDTHIPIDIHKLSISNFPEQKEMTKNDYVIICGDFGGVWNNSNEELYWRKWLNDRNFTTFFIDGNHENFDMLNHDFKLCNVCNGNAHQISDSIYHLMRGEIYNIDGYKMFVMGGASSHDKWCRKAGLLWWKEELPSYIEYNHALSVLDKNNWDVHIILSHCAPDSILSQILDIYEYDQLTHFLEMIKQRCKYQAWFFGHYHIDRDIDDKHTVLYQRLLKIIK